MKLIDKDAAVAEIERLMTPECGYSMNKLIDFLESLEVKEVDLEKSISDWLFEGLPNDEDEIDYIKETAKHFFELGLKAQKGKES